jgi:ABC-type sugar transport system permease subunit
MNYKRIPLYFLLPAVLIYLCKTIIPIIIGFYYSMFNTDGLARFIFVGMENYIQIFRDAQFWSTTLVMIKYSVMMVFAGQIISLLLALLFVKHSVINNVFRSLVFLPVIMSMVAAAFIWKVIFSYNGPLNVILDQLGLDFLKVGWLTDPHYALASIVTVGVFKGVGVGMILYMNALLTIPAEIYESANIDGAKPISMFFKITLPLMIPGISIAVITATINNLKEFEKMLILTNGGPLDSTKTLGFYIMETATSKLWVGYASAMAVILLILVATITYYQNKFFDSRTVSY